MRVELKSDRYLIVGDDEYAAEVEAALPRDFAVIQNHINTANEAFAVIEQLITNMEEEGTASQYQYAQYIALLQKAGLRPEPSVTD